MKSEKQKLFAWWANIRWFLVLVLFSIGLLHINFKDVQATNILFFLSFAGIVSLNLLFKVQVRIQNRWMTVFQIILDIVFATIVVHLTGGTDSYFVWAFLIGVITAALTTPQNGGLIAAITGSMSLMILVLLYRNGILECSGVESVDVTAATVYVLSYTGLFSGVAMIANYLSDHLETMDENIQKMNEMQAEIDDFEDYNREAKALVAIAKDVSHLDTDINTPLCVASLSLGRVNRYARDLQIEGLKKTNDEITESINKINAIMQRLAPLKKHPWVNSNPETIAEGWSGNLSCDDVLPDTVYMQNKEEL